METIINDKEEKIVNEEDQNEPLNPQDENNDTSVTAADKKKGFSEGNRNDSGTADESTAGNDTDSKDQKKT